MSTKIGRFEILSELAKSESACVYKASDPESGQTVALKAIHLEAFGDLADQVVQRILQEAESTKDLSSPNITLVYGAGEIDGQFCAAMEYIQGNSVATMLARKEGFSIWDLLDISRQVCQGLDHANQHNVFHYSLEPAKVMVTWDGTVKILSFGISSTGYVAASATGTPSPSLYYMTPEQVRGESLDARSNLFTWGAMLYEMVTDQKAFPGDDADAVRQKILEEMPTPPAQLNPKISAIASDVIMKALAKDPAERYQSGREMVNDLDKCREASSKAKKAEAPKGPAVSDKLKPAVAAKFAAPVAAKAPPASAASKFETRPAEPAFSPAPSMSEELETSWTPTAPPAEPAAPAARAPEEPKKAAAAAAGWNSGNAASAPRAPQLDPSAQFVTAVVRASVDAIDNPAANMSAAVLDEPAVEKPKIAVDPMMAGAAPAASKGISFSELDELPPMKEIYIAPPLPKAETPLDPGPLPSIVLRRTEPEKPKVQPREVAEKAIKEIKAVPPKLLLYSLAGAAALILVIGTAVFWHSHSQNTDEDGGPVSAPATSTPAPTESAPAPRQQASAPAPAPAPVQAAPEEAAPEPVAEERPTRRNAPVPAKPRNAKNKKGSAAPTLIAGQAVVDSTPEGAQIQVDGRGDPSWVTPYTVTGLAPGQHTVVISKSGFGQETRNFDVASASKTSVAIHLTALTAVLTVSSDPPGASIFVDSKDTLKVTPSQITLEKGLHTVLVRKAGYLDETSSATGVPGQALRFAPTLRPLGNVDEIKTVGKFKKLFGGNSAQAGMGKVSIKTTPKGAQIAVNRRMVEKASPVEVLLNPGNYIVDITMTGYKPVQKVITVDQSGTVAIDETLQPQ
jgi:eukaryotic-like serine/threonine-protein kinase